MTPGSGKTRRPETRLPSGGRRRSGSRALADAFLLRTGERQGGPHSRPRSPGARQQQAPVQGLDPVEQPGQAGAAPRIGAPDPVVGNLDDERVRVAGRVTRARVARACLATFVRASATTK